LFCTENVYFFTLFFDINFLHRHPGLLDHDFPHDRRLRIEEIIRREQILHKLRCPEAQQIILAGE